MKARQGYSKPACGEQDSFHVFSMLLACCQHVTSMLPACYQNVTSILPACCQYVVSMLPTCCYLVASMLPVCCQHVASMLTGYCLHIIAMLLAYSQNVKSMYRACRAHAECAKYLQINQLCPAARTEEFSVLFVPPFNSIIFYRFNWRLC